MTRREKKIQRQLKGRKIQNPKVVLAIYWLLRLLVVVTMVLELFQGDYQNVFVCFLTLILFMLPSIVERHLHIDLPDTLEIIVLLFIFAADILGEIKAFYVLVPHWDTVLHTINGFLFSAIGFCIVDVLNEDKNTAMKLSPLYMAIVAFCFSMTIGVLWEFFEWGMDCWFGFDMQKDTVIQTVNSVALDPYNSNKVISLTNIRDVAVVLQDGTTKNLGIGGYLDVGIMDTMKDLLVNLIGAVVFSVIGYFYVKTRGEGRVAKHFIPQIMEKEESE